MSETFPVPSLGRAFAFASAALLAAVLLPREAHGGGLYLTDRGVRPLGRGGAFVAGADDLGAAWYNPAGLADAGSAVLADFVWLRFTNEYTRRTQVIDAAGAVRVATSPSVEGVTPLLPIPTLAGSFAFGARKEFVVAASLLAPYTAIPTYPLTVNGAPAPSRYSLVSLDGSLLVIPGLSFAYKPMEEVRVGVGVNALAGTFQATEVFSASPPDRLLSAPEDPAYDALSRLRVGPIFAPSANAGVVVAPLPLLRIGLSAQLPFVVRAPATVDVRLPSAAPFDRARQEGDEAEVRFVLPAVLRAGVEVRPTSSLRVEVAYVRELWSAHDRIDITPKNVTLVGVTGFPSPFAVSPISTPRRFQDVGSFRAGSEYAFDVGGYGLLARAGVSYEPSAIPNAYLSPLTVDPDKLVASLGASLKVGTHWRFDAVYAHVFAKDADVNPAEAAVPRVNPVLGNPTATEAVNGGHYAVSAGIAGLGLQYSF